LTPSSVAPQASIYLHPTITANMIKISALFLYFVFGSLIYYLYQLSTPNISISKSSSFMMNDHHPISMSISTIHRKLAEKSSGSILSSFLSSITSVSTTKNITNTYVLNKRDFTVRLLSTQRDGSRLFLGTIEPDQAIKLRVKEGQRLLVVDVDSEKVYDKFTVRYNSNSSISKSLAAYTTPLKTRTPFETKELLKLDAITKAKLVQVYLGYTKVKRIHPSVVVLTKNSEYRDLIQIRIRYVYSYL